MSPSRHRARPEWEGRSPIAVATLPGRGVYARHLGHPEGVDGVHRVTVPASPTTPRPHGSFDRGWLESHLGNVDLVHVHGVPYRHTAQDVLQAVGAVRRARKPLVVTAYHLSDPAGADDRRHAEQLDVLVPHADAVVTLTHTAAEEIRRRWGIDPLVLPHPHAVDFVRMRTPRPRWRGRDFVVGVHLASLRLACDPVPLVEALCEAVRSVEDARLSLHVHASVLDPGSATYDPVTLRRLDRAVRAVDGSVRTHQPFAEAQLWDHLFGLDVSVVPGVHGSHSVWPEACHDLGTQVIMPSGCHAAGQRPCLVYDMTDGVPNVASLAAALQTAHVRGCVRRADPTDRWRERVRIAESLRALYDRLCHGGDAGRGRRTTGGRGPARRQTVRDRPSPNGSAPVPPTDGTGHGAVRRALVQEVAGGRRSSPRSSTGEEWVNAPTDR